MTKSGAVIATLAVAIGIAAAAACSDGPTQGDAGPSDAAGGTERTPPPADAADEAPVLGPDLLSATGLYSNFAARTLAPGVIAYAPRYALWSDGATKKRYLFIPPGQKIDTSAPDDWIFPEGTKVWKEFSIGSVVVETRLLWKKPEGWFEMGYAWLADGSDAVASPDGATSVLGTPHEVPPQQDCNECHTNVRDVLVGVSAIQLGASDGDGTLATLAQAGLLTGAPPPQAALDVPGSGVVKDALGYLHANCGNCHNAASALRLQSALRLRVLVGDGTPEKTAAYTTAPFLVMRHFIPPNGLEYALVPGRPDLSGIPVRMQYRDVNVDNPWAMPPIGTNVVDDVGLATIQNWIASMPCGAFCESAPAPP